VVILYKQSEEKLMKDTIQPRLKTSPKPPEQFLISPDFYVGFCIWQEHCKGILKGTILNSIFTRVLGTLFIQE